MNFKDLLSGGIAAKILKELKDGKDVSVLNAHFGQRTVISAMLPSFVYVCSDYVIAKKAYEQISCIRDDVVYLPALADPLNYTRICAGDEVNERLKALYMISSGKAKAVVTYAAAIMQLFPARELFSGLGLRLKKRKEEDFAAIPDRLVKAGYRRVLQVDGSGQFAVRGDILDISPPSLPVGTGIRVEFFGDEADTIKKFDYFTQLSTEEIDEADICPNTFVTVGEADLSKIKGNADAIRADIEQKLSKADNSLSFIYPLLPHSTFSEFVKMPYIVYDDAKQVADSVKITMTEYNSRLKSIILSGAPYVEGQLSDDVSYNGGKLAFHSVNSANRLFTPTAVETVQDTQVLSYRRNPIALCDDIKNWVANGYRVTLLCGDEKLKYNLEETLDRNKAFGATLSSQKLDTGFIFHDIKQVVIGTYDLVGHKSAAKVRRSKKDAFTMTQVGDYVVHEVHGIGICESVEKMTMGGSTRDYIVIRYRDGDKLFVPVENMDSLSKYVAGEEQPKLSKIGGADFAKVKAKVKASVKEMAFSLLELYAKRQKCEGHIYSSDLTLLKDFEATFPYAPTDDQIAAVNDCIADLTSGKVMDRLLCGDVGYGKTEVALRVAFKVIEEGKQVAFISPTTILSDQHYRTASKRMHDFGINIKCFNRFRTASEIKTDLDLLSQGKIDMAVGTHRLLSGDVKFKDLGLLILDEEQRFGVEAKEKLKLLKNNVNVLTLSATPIPRTLHMSMTGIRDMSVLDTPPAERIPVQTYVTEYSESLLKDAVTRELGRGGQVFIVYNRVETIEKFAANVRAVLGDVKLSVAHGQMKESVLERTISYFAEGGTDVLIASTIIENGIDMPNANTMIVIDSDRLGLSQLYQLRGRIGRSNKLAYAFFTYDDGKLLSEAAYKRLEAVTQYTEFGSGFKIAMRDLEIRGAGDVLGKAQHGHMEKVGYDMYCKILKEAVAELGGEETKQQREIKVAIDFPAFIPDGYVTDEEWRMELYSRIASIKSQQEAAKLFEELKDVYGEPPQSVRNLTATAMVKNLAREIGASKATFKRNECSVYFDMAKEITKETAAAANATGGAVMLSPPRLTFSGASCQKNLINFLSKCVFAAKNS